MDYHTGVLNSSLLGNRDTKLCKWNSEYKNAVLVHKKQIVRGKNTKIYFYQIFEFVTPGHLQINKNLKAIK